MADEAAPLRSALARLAALADEAAASELLQAVARAADSLPSEARSAASCLLLGSAGAAALGALERVAPSETPQLLELVLPYASQPGDSAADVAAFWSVLRGAAGLRAKRWRARAAAVRVACALARASPSVVPPVDVAEAALLRLALDDTQREVRVAASLAGATLLLDGLGGVDASKVHCLVTALLASCVDDDDELSDATRRVLRAACATDFAEALTEALGDAASSGAHTPLGSPLVLLRALGAALRLGSWRVDDQPLMDRVLFAVAKLLAAALREPDVAAAATACLAQVACVARPAALAWYTAACGALPAVSAPSAVLAAALLALAGGESQAAPPTASAVLAAVHATFAGLVPPNAIFGQEFVDQEAAASFAASAAQRLALLPLLLAQLPRATLFPAGLRPDADSGWPAGGKGVEDGGAHPGPVVALAAASYACGGSLDPEAQPDEGVPAWSSAAAAAAAEAVHSWLLQAVTSELRWRDGEMLVAASVAARAPTLRRSLLVQPIGTAYSPTAPTRFDAEVAAQALRAAVCRLGHPSATDALPAVFPCLLLALEHPAAVTRVHAQQAARHLAAAATRTSLRLRAPVLWPPLLSGLLGCEDRFWPPAVHAAVACAHVLGGDDAASPHYHELLATLLTELSRRPGDARRALPLLRAAAALVRAMRLELLRHTKQLLPLLCEWACGTEDEHRLLAAEALTAAMERIWPRAAHHAPTLWPVMLQSYAQSAGGPYDVATRAALERLAEQMHHAGGASFAAAWRESERQGGAAASAAVAPLMSCLRALSQSAPQQAEEAVSEAAAALAGDAAEIPPLAVAPEEPAPAAPAVAAGPSPLDELSAALAVDAAEPEFVLPGVDLEALLADDARVTGALDAWASGDIDALQLPAEEDDGVEEAEETLEALSQRADEDLRAFMQELELRGIDTPRDAPSFLFSSATAARGSLPSIGPRMCSAIATEREQV